MTNPDRSSNDDALNWCYPEGPGIIKSWEFPLSSGTYVGTELTNKIRQSVGLPVEWQPISNIQLIAEVRDLKRKLKNVEMRLAKSEAVRIKEFNDNDVYEVNKRIERLESKVEWIISNLVNNPIIRFLFR
jgi:hypothetical protein